MAHTPALKLCRDVCNGSKHFALDLNKTSTDHVGLMREYVPPATSGAAASSRPRLLVFEGQDGSVNLWAPARRSADRSRYRSPLPV
jgi:hypothetical protein